MGGLAQPQVLTQVLLGLCRGLDCEQALSAPRWLVGGIAGEAGPSGLLAEAGVPAKARAALGAQGWQITELPSLSPDVGEAHVIAAETRAVTQPEAIRVRRAVLSPPGAAGSARGLRAVEGPDL